MVVTVMTVVVMVMNIVTVMVLDDGGDCHDDGGDGDEYRDGNGVGWRWW